MSYDPYRADHSTREGATALAKQIEQWWKTKGGAVNVTVEQQTAPTTRKDGPVVWGCAAICGAGFRSEPRVSEPYGFLRYGQMSKKGRALGPARC